MIFINNAKYYEKIEILNTMGQIIKIDYYKSGIDISVLAPGVYLLKSVNRNTINYARFIKY